jgi:hypothetical protein
MWSRYRRWKLVPGLPLAVVALELMKGAPEHSLRWFAGLALALLLGIGYVGEEIVWMVKRKGRPCGRCGQKVEMKSFRVLVTCPHCGVPFE